MKESSFFEECWFIYGFRIKNWFFGIVKKHSAGSVAGVKFDWRKIQDSKSLIGFFHTHPGSHKPMYSDTDYRTMNAWVSCIWRDLVCGIWNDVQTKTSCYLFMKDKTNKEIKCHWSKCIFIGEIRRKEMTAEEWIQWVDNNK